MKEEVYTFFMAKPPNIGRVTECSFFRRMTSLFVVIVRQNDAQIVPRKSQIPFVLKSFAV